MFTRIFRHLTQSDYSSLKLALIRDDVEGGIDRWYAYMLDLVVQFHHIGIFFAYIRVLFYIKYKMNMLEVNKGEIYDYINGVKIQVSKSEANFRIEGGSLIENLPALEYYKGHRTCLKYGYYTTDFFTIALSITIFFTWQYGIDYFPIFQYLC